MTHLVTIDMCMKSSFMSLHYFPKLQKKTANLLKKWQKGVENLFFWIYTRFTFRGMVWMIPHQYLIKFSWKKHVKGVKKIPQSFPRLDCTYCIYYHRCTQARRKGGCEGCGAPPAISGRKKVQNNAKITTKKVQIWANERESTRQKVCRINASYLYII